MSSSLENLSPAQVGERLRIARDNEDVTQADAADAIGVARTTLVAIEKGQRRIRLSEIQKLALLYKTSINALLREEAIHVDLTPRFRSLGETSDPAWRTLLPSTWRRAAWRR